MKGKLDNVVCVKMKGFQIYLKIYLSLKLIKIFVNNFYLCFTYLYTYIVYRYIHICVHLYIIVMRISTLKDMVFPIFFSLSIQDVKSYEVSTKSNCDGVEQ